jgi:hypothetical protein
MGLIVTLDTHIHIDSSLPMRKIAATIEDILAPLAQVVERLSARRERVRAELEALNEQIERFGGGQRSNGRKVEPATPTKRVGKRIRRSREQVEAQAAEVVNFIKAAGKSGISGKEIKKQFGNLLPSVNAFLKSFAKGAKIKTTGQKSTMRYFV